MKITISRHIFGSVRGYTTLAKSEDLSRDEIAELEILSFGQTNASAYMDSLETDPAYISRPLRSGRWAVTRVFQGKPDEHNRTTLLFVSAVITTEDWVRSLKCDVSKLLCYRHLWQWDGEEKLEPVVVAIEGKTEAADAEIRSSVLCLVAAVEKYSSDKDTTIIVRDSDFDVEVLRLLNMVLPLKAKETFSCAARSLNDGLPFTVISMAKEGSVGNSKRSTISWTPTSIADNCVYRESLAGFWPPRAEPPWQFIDRCRSFSIDLEAPRVSGLDERVARRKRLRYEIEKRGVRSKRHISWKLGLIFLACAVLVCLGAGITIRATRAKANKKEVKRLVQRINDFLAKNSPENSEDKCFPTGKNTLNKLIDECITLEKDADRLLEETRDPLLQKKLEQGKIGLVGWRNLADNAHRSYNTLDSLHQQFVRLNLSEEPEGYPVRKKIDAVVNLKGSLRKHVDGSKYLLPSYISAREGTLKVIGGWLEAIGQILTKIESRVGTLVEDVQRQSQPTYYSNQEYEKYNNWKEELEKLKEDKSLTNAKDSPIPEHKSITIQFEKRLKDTHEHCNVILQDLANWKSNAKECGDKFYEIVVNDPNVGNGRFENFDKLPEAKEYLRKAHRLWPEKYDLVKGTEKLNGKLVENFKNYIKIRDDELDKIHTPVAPSDPNATKLDELLEEFEKVGKYLEESGVPNVNSLLKQLKDIEEKAIDLRSTVGSRKAALRTQLLTLKKTKNRHELILFN